MEDSVDEVVDVEVESGEAPEEDKLAALFASKAEESGAEGEAGDDNGDEEESSGLDDSEEEEDEDDGPSIGGTRENPLKHKDLPDDQFVEVFINGEKEVLSVKELAEGQMRLRAFHKNSEKTKKALNRANSVVQEVQAFKQNLRREVSSLFSQPEKLREFMLNEFPDTLEAVSDADFRERLQVYQNQDPRAQAEYWEKRRSRKAERERQRAMAMAKKQRQEVMNAETFRRTQEVLTKAQVAVYKDMNFDANELTDQMRSDLKDLLRGRRITKEIAEDALRKVIKIHRADNPVKPQKKITKQRRKKPVVERKATRPSIKRDDGKKASFKEFWKSY